MVFPSIAVPTSAICPVEHPVGRGRGALAGTGSLRSDLVSGFVASDRGR